MQDIYFCANVLLGRHIISVNPDISVKIRISACQLRILALSGFTGQECSGLTKMGTEMDSKFTKLEWSEPKLETLAVDKTLSGPLDLPAEGTFTNEVTGEVIPGS